MSIKNIWQKKVLKLTKGPLDITIPLFALLAKMVVSTLK